MKDEAMQNVLLAIRRVIAGQIYLSARMQSKLLRSAGKRSETAMATPLERLSDRELEVFELLGQGCGTRQIAETLRVSVKTVQAYCARIKEKLNLGSATQLLREAVRWYDTTHQG